MFTASLPPEIIAATLAALDDMLAHPELRTQLHANARQLNHGLHALGLKTSPHVSPVVAVTLDNVEQALAFWNRLLELGVYVNLSLPPATPDEHPLLRCSVMAVHTAEEIDRTLAIFAQAKQDVLG